MKNRGDTERRKERGWRGVAYLGFAAAAIVLIVMIWAAAHPSSPFQTGPTGNQPAPAVADSATTEAVPAYFASAAAARPYPTLLPAVDFSRDPVVERAYAVAAKIPGVLAQQPCYCHCDRMGHRSLLDCYASDHAAGCDICLMEALFAGQMTQRGQSPATIRQEIIRGDWRDIRLSKPIP